jgi:hypothetical protein
MLNKLKIAIARTCSYQTESYQVGSYMFKLGIMLGRDQALGDMGDAYDFIDVRHRIHHSRNSLAQRALDANCDYLLFVDCDMQPDFRLWNPLLTEDQQPHARRWAKPFFSSSLRWLQTHQGGIVGAPAVTGPPENKLNVFICDPQDKTKHRRMTHDDIRTIPPAIIPCIAVGTGLMLIDMNVFRTLPQPWFEDNEDEKKQEVIHSQDCAFCIKCNQNQIAVYANLLAPARHIKPEGQDPPDYQEPVSCPSTSCEPTTINQSPLPVVRPAAASSRSGVRLVLPSTSRAD